MDEELKSVIGDKGKMGYEMKDVIGWLVDDGELYEVDEDYGRKMIRCFGDFDGGWVGTIGKEGGVMGGWVDINGCDK